MGQRVDSPIRISDPSLASLAQQTINAGPPEEVDIARVIDDTISNKNGAWDSLYDYERRKIEGPVLVVNELPASTRRLILEANEAFRWGLFTATIAVCRTILEDTLRQLITANPDSVALPLNRDDLHILINSLSDKILPPEEKTIALRIKERGNQALHDGERLFSESQAHAVLFYTSKIVRLLLSRFGKALERSDS